MPQGRFITLEGADGCGKTTQARRLVAALLAEGREALLTREPGGTPLGEHVRHPLKTYTEDPPCDRCELLLFEAARAQLVEKVIRPALARGAWVVSDRFHDSTLAYQGYGRGLPLATVAETSAFACAGLRPDLTLLLEVSPETARQRQRGREARTNTAADRIEQAGVEFRERLCEGFRVIAREEPDRVATIDANGSEDAVWERIWSAVRRLS